MLTEKDKPPRPPDPGSAHGASRDVTEHAICYFEGRFVPLSEAKVSIMTHAFMYGTAVFEGIRAYWNDEQGAALRAQGARARRADPELLQGHADGRHPVRRRVDRPDPRSGRGATTSARTSTSGRRSTRARRRSASSSTASSTSSTSWRCRSATTSTRQRGSRSAPCPGARIGRHVASRPARKIVGSYVNPAFAKTEAMLNGYDEALVLTGERPCVGGLGREPLHRPRRRPDHAAGQRRHPRGHHARRDHGDRARISGSPGGRAIDRPDGALHRRRGLHLRHRRPALAGDRGRPSEGRQRRRSGRSRGSSRTATSTSSGAGSPSTATG